MKLSELFRKLRLGRDTDEPGADTFRELTLDQMVPDRTPIGECRLRGVCTVAGIIRAVRARDYRGTESFEATLADDSTDLDLVWVGRTSIHGISLGTTLRAKGTVSVIQDRLTMIDPSYTILSGTYYE